MWPVSLILKKSDGDGDGKPDKTSFWFDYTTCQKRQRSYEKAQQKITDELEISNLLKKMRDLNGMISFMKTKRLRHLNNYHKDRVIYIETSSEDHGSDSGDDRDIDKVDDKGYDLNQSMDSNHSHEDSDGREKDKREIEKAYQKYLEL